MSIAPLPLIPIGHLFLPPLAVDRAGTFWGIDGRSQILFCILISFHFISSADYTIISAASCTVVAFSCK